MLFNKTSSPRHRVGRAVALAAALTLAGGTLLWGSRPIGLIDGSETGHASPPAARDTSSQPADRAPLAMAAASAAAAPVPVTVDRSAPQSAGQLAPGLTQARQEALLASIEKQWCTHYAEADAQYLQALEQSHPFDPKEFNSAALDQRVNATLALPTQQARQAVRTRVAARWTAQLDQAGDPRSLALAALLAQEVFHESWDVREARLAAAQRQALSTTDPVVASIWASGAMNCVDTVDCRAGARQRWQAMEPANLAAWLVRARGTDSTAEQPWPVMERSQYATFHHAAVLSRLLALLPLTEPGLEREEALGIIETVRDRRPDRVVRFDLLQSCRAAKDSAMPRSTCLHAANLLWNDSQSSMFDRMQLLGLAKALDAHDEPLWSERIAALQRDFTPGMVESIFEVEFGQDVRRYRGCSGHVARQVRLNTLAEGGALKVLQQITSGKDTRPR